MKYIHRNGLPLLLRHTGPTSLPEEPPKSGSGPAILCLHDAGLQSSLFGDLLGALGATHRSLAFDLPGHGRSGSLDALPSIEAMTEMAAWVADWCRIERPILVGHGMGALVALEWARSQGDALGGLVLCGTGRALGVSEEAIATLREVTRGKASRPFDPTLVAQHTDPELMKRVYLEGIQTDPRATLVDLEASRCWADGLGERDVRDVGAALACPIRIVYGAAESDACRRRARELGDALPGATLVEVEGAAHFLPLEKPAALMQAIRGIAEAP